MRQRFLGRPRPAVSAAITLVFMLTVGLVLLFVGPGRLVSMLGPAASPTPTASPTVMAVPTTSPPPSMPNSMPTSPAPMPEPTTSAAPTRPPTAVPTVTATAPTVPSCTNVADWSLTDRLNQLIMVSGQFSNLGASLAYAQAGVGAFVLFGQPVRGTGPAITFDVARLYNSARAAGHVVPWVSTDEEGGSVARLANVIGSLPSPRQMAVQWTPAQVKAAMASHGAAMWQLGITMDLAPVLDTANASNPFADETERSFSENPQVAEVYGLAYAAGLRAATVVPVVKHFPGIGHADGDTDLGPATDPPLPQLKRSDLIPFEQAIASGSPAVMVSNAAVPGLTGTVPASLSPATYQFLRGGLHFNGVAMTDSLGAGAISAYGLPQSTASVTAIEAGADMVLIHADVWQQTLVALEIAVKSGALQASQVNASVTRILRAKSQNACG